MWSRSTKTERPPCAPQNRDGHDPLAEPQLAAGHPQPPLTVSPLPTYREVAMATKDKNTKKSTEKKPAQKTLKEKRQAKRAKK